MATITEVEESKWVPLKIERGELEVRPLPACSGIPSDLSEDHLFV